MDAKTSKQRQEPSRRFSPTTVVNNWAKAPADISILLLLILPGGSGGKESACNVGDLGLILGLGISHREGNGYPLQCSCLENSMDRGPGGLQFIGSQRVRHD